MRSPTFALLDLALLALAFPAAAQPAGWVLTPAADSQPARLTFDGFADNGVGYVFVCGPDGLSATETGATTLMTPSTGETVGDAPGSAMLPGANVMMLATDKTQGDFTPASAKPNPVRGWDLTIKLPFSDPSVKALPRAKAVSLMTTGWTGLAELRSEDRKTIGAFLAACEAR